MLLWCVSRQVLGHFERKTSTIVENISSEVGGYYPTPGRAQEARREAAESIKTKPNWLHRYCTHTELHPQG